jgi:prepilin-type processing-associated H-X9-DG protein
LLATLTAVGDVTASAAMPPGPGPAPEQTQFPKRAACAQNLLQIGVRLLMWSKDHDGQLPTRLSDVFGESLKTEGGLLVCPAAQPQVVPGGFSPSYGYVVAPGRRLFDAKPPLMLVFDGEPVHQGGRNVLFTDGDVQYIADDIFQKKLTEQLATLGEGAKVIREEDVIPLAPDEVGPRWRKRGLTWHAYATAALTAGILVIVILLAVRSSRRHAARDNASDNA